MVTAAKPRMTVEEFLEWAEKAEGDHELVHGTVVAMAPTTGEHGALQANLAFLFREALGAAPCRTQTEAGIRRRDLTDQWYEADLAVTCSAQPRGSRWVDEPVVIVEILSSSTAQLDRGTKVPDYQHIPSVQDILLVSSEQRRVTHLTRQADGWFMRETIGSGQIALQGVQVTLSLDAIYEGSGL